ncbi:HNH endonuclease [Companilactobacillus tucceti]|uniref:HNH endonuclease n=1 Tax=Companilactobacillus tucceti TaxID=238012 RepID=UPI0009F91329|nr:HNH endonuclease [Companilactobacillus tucceti]
MVLPMLVSRCKHLGCHTLVPREQVFCDAHKSDIQLYEQRKEEQRKHIKRHTKSYNKQVRSQSEERRQRESFYHSKQWKKIREYVLTRDNYLCQYCLRFGIIRPSKTVDHIVPGQVAPDLITDVDNLSTICYSCHRRKTEWEQGFYKTGYRNDNQKVKTDILLKNIYDLPNFSK